MKSIDFKSVIKSIYIFYE